MARGLLLVPLLVAVAHVQTETLRFCECHFQGILDVAKKETCRLNEDDNGEPVCRAEVVPYITDVYEFSHMFPQKMFKAYPFYYLPKKGKEICKLDGARLATPRTRDEFNYLGKVLKKSRLRCTLIGYESENGVDGVWKDCDGARAPKLPWAKGHPAGKDNTCMQVLQSGEVKNVNCKGKYPFICERPLRVKVPKGYKYHFQVKTFYKLYKEEKTFRLAKKTCELDGGTLAVPENWDELYCIMHTMQSYPSDPYIDYTDEAEEGNFVTSNGRRMQDMEVDLWRADEPDNGAPFDVPENCVTLNHDGYYADVPCHYTQPFICQLIPY